MNETDNQVRSIETIDNHIYFYSEIDAGQVLELIKRLKELDARLQQEQITREASWITPIWLHIQSGGGDLFAGFSAADQIARIKTPIYSVVEGYAASAATLISLSCDQRFILPSAFMMIHQLSSGLWGKYEECKDGMRFLDMAMDRVVSFYAARTGMKKKKVRKLLKRDSWFAAAECVERGLADAVVLLD